MPRLCSGTLIVIALAGLLAACSTPTPYQPRTGSQGGYTDERLGPTRYRITFSGNSVTGRETVENYLLLRSSQVTLQAGYRFFVFDTRDTEAKTNYHTEFEGWPGYRHRFGWYWHDWDWDYADTYPTTHYNAYAEIVLLTPEQAKLEPRSVDAQDVVTHLTPPPPPAKS
jgi:hypothetical protein